MSSNASKPAHAYESLKDAGIADEHGEVPDHVVETYYALQPLTPANVLSFREAIAFNSKCGDA